MHLSKNRKYLILSFAVLSALFLWLRLRTVGHVLMWDEAWNILSLRSYLAGAVKDPFYWFYKFHPPLYMLLAGVLSPFKEGIDIRLEVLSLFIAYATFIAAYLMSARIGGWKFAALSGLFLSIMPSSIGYDTWIKRGSLASLFGYIALFLLLKRRFFWCGVGLALALLSKESGIFFCLAAALFILLSGEKHKLKKIFVVSSVAFILSSWWYVFFSEFTSHGPGFFFTKNDYSTLWSGSSLYFIKKLFPDIGPIQVLFLLIGIIFMLRLSFGKGQKRWLFPVLAIACVYIPISLVFTLKAPWLFLPARPALAMAAGGGALWLFRKSKNVKYLLPVTLFLLAAILYAGVTFSYEDYHAETYPSGWPGANSSMKLALYLNKHVEKSDKIMMTGFAYWRTPLCAVFLYYSKPQNVLWINKGMTAEEIRKKLIKDRISWLVVISSPEAGHPREILARKLQKIIPVKPDIVGWSYVWRTKKLWS